MKKSILLLCMGSLLFSCSFKKSDPSVASIYAPGNVNTHMSERDAALSADEQLFFFSVQLHRNHSTICFVDKIKRKWGRPLVAPFSGKHMDMEPVFHPDGRLFFVSNRPLPGEEETADFNIWYVNKTEEGWSEPLPVDSIVNSEANEFYPSFTSNGDMYFTSTLPTGKGGEDLWVSRWREGRYGAPENLGDAVNTASFEYNSFVHPEGRYLLFTSHGWGEGYGTGDLYVSFNDDGIWQKPLNLGDKVNTEGFEYCPSLSPDGKTLFFSRKNIPHPDGERWGYFEMLSNFSSMQNGQGGIYAIRADFIETLRK